MPTPRPSPRACAIDRLRVVDDLVMEGDVVGPRLLERLEVVLGVVHHEVDVEDAAAHAKERRDRLRHDRADRDRLDEVPVADVELEDLGAAVEERHHVVAEPCEIRRVDRRLDLGPAHPLVPAHRRDLMELRRAWRDTVGAVGQCRSP